MPTLLTLGNLTCGFFAVVVAARVDALGPFDLRDSTNLMWAGWLLFLAMLCDGFDGSVARWSKTASGFGVQLDSLADVVSFGVAPAFLLVKMCPSFTLEHREIVWAIAAGFAACAALRLARFNSETNEGDDHLHFRGLPSPAAAASLAALAIMFRALRQPNNPLSYAEELDSILQSALPWYAVLLGLLMVSRIRYPHVVNQFLRGKRGPRPFAALLLALVAVIALRSYALPLLAAVFALGPAVRYVWEDLVLGKAHEEPLG